MKRYRVLGRPVNINGGTVMLIDDQAKPRMHNLKDLGKGVYEVINPIQFKQGEEFCWDGVVNKALLEDLEAVEELKSGESARDELIMLIEKCETVDQLEALKDHELMKKIRGKNRQAVMEAGQVRYEELTADDSGDTSKTGEDDTDDDASGNDGNDNDTTGSLPGVNNE